MAADKGRGGHQPAPAPTPPARPLPPPTSAGDIVFELIVIDAAGNRGDPDTVTITVDVLPVAEAGDDQTVAPSASVTLDGTASTDTEDDKAGTPLTYAWALTTSVPDTTSVTLTGGDTASTELHRPRHLGSPHLYPHGDRLL